MLNLKLTHAKLSDYINKFLNTVNFIELVWTIAKIVIQRYNYRLKLLDFVINRFFMKMLTTSNMHVVSHGQKQFNFDPYTHLAGRAEKFVNKLYVDQVYLSLFLCYLATSFC